MTTLNGIDVSNWQGDAFPWQAYKGKIQFAGVRVSEGLKLADEDAKANIAGAHSIGIPVIGYHLLHAALDGAEQAEWFLSHAHAAGLRPGDHIAVDAEDGGLDGLTAAHLNMAAFGFGGQLHKHFPGYSPWVYTELSLTTALVSMGDCPLWLANPSGMTVKACGPWKQVSAEQTGQRGVDTDVFYGDASQLAKLAF